MGLCLFNNVAVAAQLAIAELGVRRVLILDWDGHHGNGTAEIFRRRDDSQLNPHPIPPPERRPAPLHELTAG